MMHPEPLGRSGFDDEDDEITQLVPSGPPESLQGARDRLTLVVVDGASPGRPYPLESPAATLGRSSRADIRLDAPSLSRLHAAFRLRRDGWVLEDLGSTNGTWLDEVRIGAPTPIASGQRLRLGNHTSFRLVLQDREEQEATMAMFRSSITDPLTGLRNRGYFDQRLLAELAYAQRHRSPLTLVLLDIDHFKRVNDRHGHPVGDSVLRLLGACLLRTTRLEDLAARYGGEEFAIIARGLTEAQGVQMAERLRLEVERLAFSAGAEPLRITVSLGVATHQDPSTRSPKYYGAPRDLIAAADEALYRAKASGRNRTCTA
jgi:two-component system cell cycle response regulator